MKRCMISTGTDETERASRRAHRVLWTAPPVCFLIGGGMALSGPHDWIGPILMYLATNTLIVAWVHYDSIAEGCPLGVLGHILFLFNGFGLAGYAIRLGQAQSPFSKIESLRLANSLLTPMYSFCVGMMALIAMGFILIGLLSGPDHLNRR